MANQSAKRVTQQNAQRMSLLSKLFIGINAFYIFIRVVFQYRSLSWTGSIMYLATAGVETLLYMNLYSVSRPRYDPGGVLVSSGTDLSQPGLVSYMFDYIYISWFVHVLSLLTKWAWALYFVIPVYVGVLAAPYVKQFLGSRSSSKPAPSAEDEAKEKKRREKKERKQQRAKYVRA
ncbi:hypothetical protein LPJ77_002813 [Coemansia sp. RSA 2523]|nr:hypothetical protein LPJ77_002813 [Coemansia sp. RSA 2523]